MLSIQGPWAAGSIPTVCVCVYWGGLVGYVQRRGGGVVLQRVKDTYHPDPAAHRLGWQVAPELGADGAAVAVRPRHFAPDDADPARLLVAGARRAAATQNDTSLLKVSDMIKKGASRPI